jgi:RNA polymerase sigma-70 factor (ECF subfamily)
MIPIHGPRYSADPVEPVSDAELARQFWPRVRALAARRLGDAAAAEDVAQETIRRVMLALREGRVQNLAALPAFVLQTARNLCALRHRSAGREDRALHRFGAEPRAAAPDPLASLIAEERRTAVRRALERLTTTDRDLIRLVYYEGIEGADLARRLAVTPGALRARKHRALGRLAELLEAERPAGREPPQRSTATGNLGT